MKKLTMLFLVLFAAANFAQELRVVHQPDITEGLNDIYFPTADKGFIVGDKGYLLRTTDGGDNWELLPAPTDKDITEVFFLNENLGWAGTGDNFMATRGGTILKTTDGGDSWSETDYSSAVPDVVFTYCEDIKFLDENTGYMISGRYYNFFLLKTTDGGATWTELGSVTDETYIKWMDTDWLEDGTGIIVGNEKDANYYVSGDEVEAVNINDNFFNTLHYVKWLDDNTAIAIGEGREFSGIMIPIYKFDRTNKTWRKIINMPFNYYRARDGYFVDSERGVGVGSNGFSRAFVHMTHNAGENWESYYPDLAFGFQSVSGVDTTLFAIGTSSHIARSYDFGRTWEPYKATVPTSIYGIQYVDNMYYAVNRSGVLLKSDNGRDWEYVSETGMDGAYDFYFQDANTGFMVKENSHFVKTTDGGVSWRIVHEPIRPSDRNDVGGIAFADENTGFVWVSETDYDKYVMYKTTDGGEDWDTLWTYDGSTSISGDLAFFDANAGFIAGPDAWIYYTSDAGANWETKTINNLPAGLAGRDFDAVEIVDANTAWAVGSNLLAKTEDKGVTWNFVSNNLAEVDTTFNTVSFTGAGNGFIGTAAGNILQTTDGGVNWTKIDWPGAAEEYYFFCSETNDQGEIFLGTSAGLIVSDLEIVSVEEDTDNIPDGYSLGQNYPNPFNPSTVITYSLPERSNVSLKVYDILGNQVKELAQGIKPAGTYKVQFNAQGLSAGVYVYELKAGAFSSANKMLLLK